MQVSIPTTFASLICAAMAATASADFRYAVAPAGSLEIADTIDVAAVATLELDLFVVEDDPEDDGFELADPNLGLTGAVFSLTRTEGDAALTAFEFAPSFGGSFLSEFELNEISVEATGATPFGGSTDFGVDAGEVRAARLGTVTIDVGSLESSFTIVNGITSQGGAGESIIGDPFAGGREITPAGSTFLLAVPEPSSLMFLATGLLLRRQRSRS